MKRLQLLMLALMGFVAVANGQVWNKIYGTSKGAAPVIAQPPSMVDGYT